MALEWKTFDTGAAETHVSRYRSRRENGFRGCLLNVGIYLIALISSTLQKCNDFQFSSADLRKNDYFYNYN